VDDNDHHYKVLERAVENGKAPNFLKLNAPKVRIFADQSAESLQQIYRNLDEAALVMLKCILSERHLLCAKLCREAEELLRTWKVRLRQSGWPRRPREKDGMAGPPLPSHCQSPTRRRPIPVSVRISSKTFLIAMKRCRFKVSTLMETKLLEKAGKINVWGRNRNYEGLLSPPPGGREKC
jgi:hypothetical protein